MTSATRRELENAAAELRKQADERAEWSDAERWWSFLTGENPRTGEPLSDEREAERQRGWAAFLQEEP